VIKVSQVAIFQVNRQHMYIVRRKQLYGHQKHVKMRALQNSLKRSRNKVILIVFNGILCKVRADTVTVSDHRST
jgi:hypothetical protein